MTFLVPSSLVFWTTKSSKFEVIQYNDCYGFGHT
jgi:hypothetical protein